MRDILEFEPDHERCRRRRHHDLFGPEAGRGMGHRGGPGGPGGGRGWRRGLRAPRGDVRAAVLQLLGEGPAHGYQLMQQIAERSEGAWRPSPGTIYPVLAQLEDEGLVEISPDQGRKSATLTDEGRAFVLENAAELGDPFGTLRAERGSRVDLRDPMEELLSAARQLARSGNVDQQEAARTVLREAKRSLYLILADGDLDPGATGADARE